MADTFQTIVDVEVSEEDAPAYALTIIAWLIDEKIIQPAQTKCVLGSSETGYPPAENYHTAVDNMIGIGAPQLLVNGLEVIIGRTVFPSFGQTSTQIVFCSNCGTNVDGYSLWQTAVTDWYEGNDGLLQCETCRGIHPITQWQFEPQWGVRQFRV